jgi:uncharacterized RDD family membrane protein YckC
MEPSLRETSTLIVRPPPLPHLRRPVAFTAHVAAFLFDVLALLALFVAGGLIVGLIGELPRVRSIPPFAAGLCLIAVVLLPTLGDIVLAASPGKWIFGLAIRTPAGDPAPLGRLVLRWLVKYASLLLLAAQVCAKFIADRFGLADTPLLTWAARACEDAAKYWAYAVLAGALLALLPARRTLHDLLAGTAVYSVPVRRSEVDAATLRRGFEITPVPPPADPAMPAPSDSPS